MDVVNFSLRLYRFIKRHVNSIVLYIKHSLNTTFSNIESELISMPIDLSLFTDSPIEVIDLYHQHFFDILGSGWTQVKHKKKYFGFEGNNYSNNLGHKFNFSNKKENIINSSNREYSDKLNKKLDKNYIRIDWQVDIKSGYRWSESTHYKFIKFGHLQGVDVKIPWELSRMHHLVSLAIHYSKNSNSKKINKSKIEFQNQVIDFIANNPPGFGVNWVCPMDVSIRISNILLAYDIFKSSKCDFSNDFKSVLAKSIYDHGKHIIDNLEFNNGVRGNHYFSNIIGLLFCSNHLKFNETIQAWFVFGVSELINEFEFQFHVDGSNFEGSTLYHRLVTEFAIWGTVMALEKPEEMLLNASNNKLLKKIYLKNNRIENLSKINSPVVFSKQYFQKLKRTLNFLKDIMSYDGTIPQIGDNDSGRLFKLCTSYEKTTVKKAKKRYLNLKNYNELENKNFYFIENHLKADSFLKYAQTLLSSKISKIDDKICSGFVKSEFDFLKTLFKSSNINYFSDKPKKEIVYKSKKQVDRYLKNIYDDKSKKVIKKNFKINDFDFISEFKLIKYDCFGIYIYKGKNTSLIIRAKNHKSPPIISGHFHQDQLSLEMHINRVPIIVDPGTYVYTSSPKKRNLYRSENAHFSPITNHNNQSDNYNNIFQLNNIYSSKVLHFSNFGFYGTVFFQNNLYERLVLFNNNGIDIIDVFPKNQTSTDQVKLPHSLGYGILEAI